MGNKIKNAIQSILKKVTNWAIINPKNVAFILISIIVVLVITDLLWHWLNWTAIEAIATVILLLSILIAIGQINETRKSTNAQIAMELFRELRDEKAIDKMRSIYKIDTNEKYLSESTKNDIDYILDRLDTLGNLVKMKIIDDKLAIETYGGPPALRFWYKIKSHIVNVQKERGIMVRTLKVLLELPLTILKIIK